MTKTTPPPVFFIKLTKDYSTAAFLNVIIFSHYISDAAAKKHSKLPPAFRIGLFLLFMVCNDHLDNGFVTLKTITTCLRC